MARQLRRATLIAPFMLLAGFLALSCFDNAAGPRVFQGQFSLAPQFESSVAGIVTIDRFRVLLRRTADGSVALDTVIAVAPGSDSVDLSLSVPMLTSSETFLLTLYLITPAGDTAFRAGPTTVTPSSSGAPPAIPVAVAYVGVGATAKTVRIVTDSSRVFFGDTVTLLAEALDSAGAVILGTPIAWGSLDTLRARVPNPALGKAVGAVQRGSARITATLLTGLADTTAVLAQPRPVRAAVEAGNGQSATVLGTLAQPVRVRVKAADSLGVSGIRVRFQVTSGGGSLDLDSAVTDDSGSVDVHWTLGAIAGPQTAQARVRATIADSVLAITATAVPGAIRSVTVTPGADTITALTDTTRFTAVARDSLGNLVTGAGVTWTSSAPTVASVNASGLATAVGNGTTLIVAAASGIADTATLRVNQIVATVAVAPALDTLTVIGDTAWFSAVALDAKGQNVAGTVFVWASTLPSVAIIDGTGLATSTGIGSTLIIANAGGLADSATLVVASVVSRVVVTPAADTATSFGDSILFAAQAFDAGDNPVATDFTWSSTDTLVARVAPAGLATAVGNGTASIIAASNGVSDTAIMVISQIRTRVGFLTPLTNVAVHDTIRPPVQVAIQDARGNRVATATDTVVLTLLPDPACGGGSPPSVRADTGVATFADLVIDNLCFIGTGYRGLATATGLTPDTSNTFDILAPAGVVQWISPTSGNWSDGARWSTGSPPAALDTVLITQSGTYTVTLDVSPTFADLTVGGATGTQTLVVNGQSVTVTGNSLTVGPNAVLDFASGTIAGPGALHVFGTLNWSGGTMSAGLTRIESGGLGNITGASGKTLTAGHRLDVLGQLALSGTGNLAVGGNPGAELNILTSGVFDWQSTADLVYQGFGAASFSNAGTLTKSGAGTAAVGIDASNSGTIQVQLDTLHFFGATTHGGTTNLAAGTVLLLSNATHTLPAGFAPAGAGRVLATSGTLVLGAAATDTVRIARLHLIGANVNGPGVLVATDTLYWTTGVLGTAGTFSVPAGVTLEVSGTAGKTITTGSRVDVAGRLRQTGTGNFFIGGTPAAQLNILASGVFDWQSTADVVYQGFGAASFSNAGTLAKSGAGTGVVGIDATNTGTVDIAAIGDTVAFDGAFTHADGAVLQGGGTLNLTAVGALTLDGDVNPGTSPGLLTVLGPYAPSALSALTIELGGQATGTERDLLAVSGTATLNGALVIDTLNGFTPAVNDTFTVLTFGLRTGTFASLVFPGGFTFDTVFTATTLRLVTLTGALSGGTWTGAVGTDWNVPANWSSGAVPGPFANAFIPAAAPNQPMLSGQATIDSLTLEPGATLTLAAATDTLTLNGSLDAGYTSIVGAGTVVLAGTAGSAAGSVPSLMVRGDYTATDSILVGGNLGVTGAGANLIANGRRIAVTGDLAVRNAATLTMTNAADTVAAGGVTFDGASTAGRLTSGLLIVRRAFAQLSSASDSSFFADVGHVTRLESDTIQNVAMASPDSAAGSHFGTLQVIQETSAGGGQQLALATPVWVRGPITLNDNNGDFPLQIDGPGELIAAGNISALTSGAGVDVLNGAVRVGGALSLSVGVTYQADTTEFFGAGQTIPVGAQYAYRSLVVSGTATLAGSLALPGDLITRGLGQLDIGTFDLTTAGNVRALGSGVTGAGGRVIMNGPTGAQLEGTVPNLDVLVPDGQAVSLNAPIHATGILSLQGGTLALSGHGALIDGQLQFNAALGDTASLSFGSPDGVSSVMTAQGGVAASGVMFLSMHEALDTLVLGDYAGWYGTVPSDTALTGGALVFMNTFDEDGNPGFQADTTGGTTVVMAGANTTVYLAHSDARLRHLRATGDSVAFGYSGNTVHGDLTVAGGGLFDVGAADTVRGNVATQDAGALRMTDPSDQLWVFGNVSFGGGSETNRLTNGTLTLHGNFVQAGGDGTTFAASGTHITRFEGNALGTQTISFSDFSASRFAALQMDPAVTNAQQVTLLTDVSATDVSVSNAASSGLDVELNGPGRTMHVSGAFTVSDIGGTGRAAVTNMDRVRLFGSLALGGAAEFSPNFAEFDNPTGMSIPPQSGSATYNTVQVFGNNVVPGGPGVLIGGDLVIGGLGDLNLNGFDVTVLGNFVTLGLGDQGTIALNGGEVLEVHGNAVFAGGDETDSLTNGTLRLLGSFSQSDRPTAFVADPGLVVELIGSAATPQSVGFADPAISHFGTLFIQQTGARAGVELNTEVNVLGALSVAGNALGAQTVLGFGNTLRVGALDVNTLTLDHVPLVWTDTGAFTGGFTQFQTVDLVNYVDTETQITVNHLGWPGPVTFDAVHFGTQPTTGLYVSATDLDGGAFPYALTINMQNAIPSDGSAFEFESVGATVNWTAPANLNSWINAAGGLWSTGSNWSKGVPPVATDSVLVTLNGTYTVTLDQAAAVASLQMGGLSGAQTLAVGSNALTIDQFGIFNPGATLDVAGGTLDGAGSVVIAGQLNWNGGTMQGAGTTVVSGTSSISGATVLDTRALQVLGTTTITGTGLSPLNDPIVFIGAGGTLELVNVPFFFLNGTAPTLVNQGTLRTLAGAGDTTRIDWPIDNTGKIDVASGLLDLRGTLAHSSDTVTVRTGAELASRGHSDVLGTLVLEDGARLSLTAGGVVDGQHILNPTSAIVGLGTVNLEGANLVDVQGAYDVDTTLIQNATVEFNSASDTAFTNGGSYLGGGSLGGAGIFAIRGGFSTAPGNVIGAGRISVLSGGVLTFASTFQRTIDVAGTLIWPDSSAGIPIDLAMAAGANLNVLPGGVFQLPRHGRNMYVTTTETINNAGTIVLPTGSDSVRFQPLIVNDGTIDIQSGTLAVQRFTHQAGAVVQGTGTLDVALAAPRTLGGAFNPAATTTGVLSVTGVYDPTASGVLNIELGGTIPGTEYDQLAVTTATLGGTLNVTLVNGFTPISGQSFTILTSATTLTGTFASFTLPPGMTISYTANSVIVAVP